METSVNYIYFVTTIILCCKCFFDLLSIYFGSSDEVINFSRNVKQFVGKINNIPLQSEIV